MREERLHLVQMPPPPSSFWRCIENTLSVINGLPTCLSAAFFFLFFPQRLTPWLLIKKIIRSRGNCRSLIRRCAPDDSGSCTLKPTQIRGLSELYICPHPYHHCTPSIPPSVFPHPHSRSTFYLGPDSFVLASVLKAYPVVSWIRGLRGREAVIRIASEF